MEGVELIPVHLVHRRVGQDFTQLDRLWITLAPLPMHIKGGEAFPYPRGVRARVRLALECWNPLTLRRESSQVLDLGPPFKGPGKHLL